MVLVVLSAGGAGGFGRGQDGPDLHHRGPSSEHHSERRPHRCLPGGGGGGAGDASAADGPERSLPHAGHQTNGPLTPLGGNRGSQLLTSSSRTVEL